jgi:hypothetical protein
MKPEQAEHLRLLSIFHYVFAGVLALVACLPLIHVALGLTMVFAPQTFGGGHGPPPPMIVGWMFILLGGGFIVCGWTAAALLAWAGRCLARRVRYTYCLVMAGVACVFMPLGTLLGVFTILLLAKPEVKAAFGQATTA